MVGVYGVVGAATLGVGEFGTDSVQHELLFRVLVHHVPLWAWPTAALAVVFVCGIEGGVQENRRLLHHYDAALAAAKARQDDEPAKALLRIEQERRYEEMRPVLEARIVPWTGRNFGRSHRLEVRIMSTWQLATIFVTSRLIRGQDIWDST